MRGHKRKVEKRGREWVVIYGAGMLMAYFPTWCEAVRFALERQAF